MAVYTISLASGSVLNGLGPGFDKNEAAASTLTVTADGYLISDDVGPNNDAQLTGANWTVNVQGAIGTLTPGGSGLLLYGGPGAKDTVNVSATGTIFSEGLYGIYTERALTLNNMGAIISDGTGIRAGGATAITNSGRIEGATTAINLEFASGLTKITNSGVIKGGNAIDAASGLQPIQVINTGTISGVLDLSNVADTITNSKTIEGNILARDGADTITNNAAGVITGLVALGDGANKFTNFGTILGDVTGGNDASLTGETFTNTKTISGTIRTGGGKDTVKNSGFLGNIDVQGGTVAITNSKTIDGAVVESAPGATTLVNSGTINGGVVLSFATNLGDPDVFTDEVTNSGTIGSSVDLGRMIAGDAADKLKNSGTILGTINLGFGDNTLNNTKTIQGAIFAGDGNDTITNSGTIGAFLGLGGGDDVVNNTGSIAGPLDLGAGNDEYFGGSKSDNVTDSDGADKIKLGAGNDRYVATGAVADGNDEVEGSTNTAWNGTGEPVGDFYNASAATNGTFINLDSIHHPLLFGEFTASTFGIGAATIASLAWGQDISGDGTGNPATTDKITGFEHAYGGAGSDLIWGNAAANYIRGDGGDDVISGRGGNDLIEGGAGTDRIEGGDGADRVFGGDDSDVLYGDTRLVGASSSGAGNDILDGGGGVDFLVGGGGKDILTGGGDADGFIFMNKSESGLSAVTRDVITDFEGSGFLGGDVIDLSAIDANETTPIGVTNESFVFTVDDGFAAFQLGFVGGSGQLRFQFSGGNTLILGETNGDGKADFSIELTGVHFLDSTNVGNMDFFL